MVCTFIFLSVLYNPNNVITYEEIDKHVSHVVGFNINTISRIDHHTYYHGCPVGARYSLDCKLHFGAEITVKDKRINITESVKEVRNKLKECKLTL